MKGEQRVRETNRVKEEERERERNVNETSENKVARRRKQFSDINNKSWDITKFAQQKGKIL